MAGQRPPEHPARCCYVCGHYAHMDRFCVMCGAALATDGPRQAIGRAYLLNELPRLVSEDGLTPAVAARIRDRMLAEREAPPSAATAATRPAEPPAAVSPPAQVARGPAAVAPGPVRSARDLDLGASTLLLYVGAFLVVVSALIFVNVSGDQISDSTKLVLMLIGTLGFLGAGIVCHRAPSIRQAGRTFLIIGALITPLDFAAYYALVARQSPFTSPALWLIGSFMCGGLYAALRIGGYGRGYSYLLLAAYLSAAAAAHSALELPDSAFAVPFAFVVLSVEAVRLAREPYASLVLNPLRPAVSAIALLAVVGLIGPLSSSSVPERWAAPLHAFLLTGYYSLRARRGPRWERVIAHFGPAAVVLSAARALDADLRGLAIVLLGLAAAHAVAATARWSAARVPWLPREARYSSAFLAIASMLSGGTAATGTPLDAAVLWAGALVLAALSTIRIDGLPVTHVRVLTVLGVLAAALAYSETLTAAGLIAPTSSAEQVGLAYVPFALALGVIAGIARSWTHALPLAASSAAVSLLTVLSTLPSAPLHTIATITFAVAAAAGSVRAGPRALMASSAFATLALFGLLRWADAAFFWWPLALAIQGAAAAPFALRRSVPARWRDAARLIALASLGIATATGFVLSTVDGGSPWDTRVWRSTIAALLALGAVGSIASRQLRSGMGELVSSLALPLAAEMAVAMVHADLLEAYTLPLAAWAFAVAAAFARRRSSPEAEKAAEYAGAALLLAPTLVQGWDADDLRRIVIGATAGVAMLGFATWSRRERLARSAIAALALVVLRAADEPIAMDPFSAALGAAVIGLAYAVGRYAPDRLPPRIVAALEVVGAALILAPTIRLSLESGETLRAAAATAGAVGMVAAGLFRGRPWLAAAGLAVLAVEGLLALANADERQWIAIGTGLLLLVLGTGGRPLASAATRHLLRYVDGAGLALFLLPAFVLTFGPDAAAQTGLLLAQLIVVLVAGAVLRLRRHVVASLALLGIEALRVLADVVDRLPNWASFGIAGAVLLLAGFVLLARRDSWSRWRATADSWWAAQRLGD